MEKAERLIRDLLAKNGNDSTYWCLLGDILHESSAYEKAIEVTNLLLFLFEFKILIQRNSFIRDPRKCIVFSCKTVYIIIKISDAIPEQP